VSTAYASYHVDAILALPPAQLLLRVYDALLLRIREADEAFCAGDRARAGNSISRAFDIVNALREALDGSRGAECVPPLDRLYRTVGAWLLEANLTQSRELLQSTQRVMAKLKEGWDGAARDAS
jgi:flagellar biosynthetic protein FliS